MVVWRFQSSKYPLINSEGARLTGGRWNRVGTSVIYASENTVLAAMEVIVHHGGIPQDYVCIKIEIHLMMLKSASPTFRKVGLMLYPKM